MSLAEYRTSTSVDVSLVDPFATRLLGLLEHYGGRVLIVSGRRSRAEQQALRDKWADGLGAYAALPGSSLHERGAAADLRIVAAGLSWRSVHAEAEIRGVRFPLWDEDWHAQSDEAWTEPEQKEDDMTLDQLAQAFGGALDAEGRVVIPLADGNLYPLGNILGFIHGELTRDDLLVARIAAAIEQ